MTAKIGYFQCELLNKLIMKYSKKLNKRALALLPLLLVLILAGCNFMEEVSMSDEPVPQMEMGEEETPCRDLPNVEYDFTFELVDPGDYPGGGAYEFAVLCTGAEAYSVPEGCTCTETYECIWLSFPISYVSHAGFSKIIGGSPTPIVPIPVTSQGTYQGFEPPAGIPSGGVATHRICNRDTDEPFVIFFNLPAGFPGGMDVEEAIADNQGICIVGDYPDPRPPRPDTASGDPNTIDSTGVNP